MLLHTVFPPRKLATPNVNQLITRVGRETILRKNFYLRFTDENGAETSSRYSGISGSTERVELDLELFLMEALIITCLTTIGALAITILDQPQVKERESGRREVLTPTPHTTGHTDLPTGSAD